MRFYFHWTLWLVNKMKLIELDKFCFSQIALATMASRSSRQHKLLGFASSIGLAMLEILACSPYLIPNLPVAIVSVFAPHALGWSVIAGTNSSGSGTLAFISTRWANPSSSLSFYILYSWEIILYEWIVLLIQSFIHWITISCNKVLQNIKHIYRTWQVPVLWYLV